MATPPRDRPHLYWTNHGSPEPYTSPSRGGRRALPQRDRLTHAGELRSALQHSIQAASLARPQASPGGIYLDFSFPPKSDGPERLESRKAELIAVREGGSGLVATAFLPFTAQKSLVKKLEQYETENTKPKKTGGQSRPRHERLVAAIDSVTHTLVESLLMGPGEYPQPGEKIWWELWLRRDGFDHGNAAIEQAGFIAGDGLLEFPHRVVRRAFGDTESLGRLFVNSNVLAEIHRIRESPAVFLEWSNREQAAWAKDAVDRLQAPPPPTVAVTLLDTGVNRAHPMLAPLIAPDDVAKHDPTWNDADTNGHGTAMAGLALFGDLVPVLTSDEPIRINHALESVKVLPDEGLPSNEAKLYGVITRESVARASIAAPFRRRVVCMAITSDESSTRGSPTSWSAAVDQVSWGEISEPQLVLLSAGNVRQLQPDEYPDRNDVESIEYPAQAWNALTVGAFTDKVEITHPDFAGWTAVAPQGGLCPSSRTAVGWIRSWPVKPDVVMEGGNYAHRAGVVSRPDDLGLLSTFHQPAQRHFDIMGDTSGATALAAHLAASLSAQLPGRWPETIRGLIVHSAEWTSAMEAQRSQAKTETEKLHFLRRYGYGVPHFERAHRSATNDLTLVFEETVRPFKLQDKQVKTHEMKLHPLPWPTELLSEHMPDEVELRVTLSYFIEPNPGERGWLRKHRYASHGFRFDLKRPTESQEKFRSRISKQSEDNESELAVKTPEDSGWTLGRIRNMGCVHSDIWRGTAADLAHRDLLAVCPRSGWWKENVSFGRYDCDCRYALIVSLRVPATLDIYTAIANPIDIAT